MIWVENSCIEEFTRENECMVGYIFRAENTVTKKTYIGKYYSVRFDKKYIGNDSGVLSDAEKYGRDKFIVNMIRACETVKDCDAGYELILKELNAKSDEHYYNYEAPVEKEVIKKPRKKKVVDE